MLKKQYELNQDKKADVSIIVILLLSAYMVWQMGVMYFSGKAISLSGRTPIEVSETYLIIALASGYLSTIAFHYFFSKYSLIIGRLAVSAAFIVTIALFFHLPASAIKILFYVNAFLCTFLIGTTYAYEIELYTTKSVLNSNFITVIVTAVVISLIQNDFFEISYFIFNIVSVFLLAMLMLGYCLLPTRIETLKTTLQQARENVTLPKWVIAGLYLAPIVSTVTLVFSITFAEATMHGVFLLFLCGGGCASVMFVLNKKIGLSPFRISSIAFSLAAVGFMFAALSLIAPWLSYVAIVMNSANLLVANMMGYFGNLVFRYRPIKAIAPTMVGVGFVIAMLQAGLLELFRNNTTALFGIMSVMSLIFAVAYILIEPTLRYNIESMNKEKHQSKTLESSYDNIEQLSARDRRIVELMLCGYTVAEIAKTMSYAEQSIKTYKKNIYCALDVHSKRELYIWAKKRDKNL